MENEAITFWEKFWHKYGVHAWSKDLLDDYVEWDKAGRDGDIAFWHVCKICGEEFVIQTRY